MMFSIIIPAKNEESKIEKTLSQFKALKMPHELIVYDGISTDNTVKLAKKYTKKVFIQKERKMTIAKARNCGARHAVGDIFLFFDADIRINDINHFFKRISEVFEDEQVVAATTPILIYPEEACFKDNFFHNMMNFLTFLQNGARGECQIMRKSAFKKTRGYDAKFVAAEDFELYSRLRKIGKVKYLWDLKVFGSPRRFRKVGYLKMFYIYAQNGISMKLFHRSYSKEWVSVR
jgi:glycosyltransferase involved in cell wall biosynthesis